MWLRPAAIAVLVLVPCDVARAQASNELTLDGAFDRVAESHPDLRLVRHRGDVLGAELDRSSMRPPLVAGASVENALGTDDASGLRGAELTLTLASVLERGGKLDARKAVAQGRIDALAIEREARRLDLLAEVARRYLAIVAAQRQRAIAELDIAQRTRTVAAARHRLRAGASPESVVLTAEAALARAELDRARAEQRERTGKQHLAALWGEREPHFTIPDTDPTTLPAIADFAALADLVERTPELDHFAGERRIREARLQLARSSAAADVDWQVGVRRLQETRDVALVASLSIPIGASRRALPDIAAAEAELVSLEVEREGRSLSLYSTLVEAHGRYRLAEVEVARLRDDVLPKLVGAESAAERAYRAGASSALEWAQVQAECTAARKQQLDAALDAQRALIEIQRLTGQAFVAAGASQPTQGIDP